MRINTVHTVMSFDRGKLLNSCSDEGNLPHHDDIDDPQLGPSGVHLPAPPEPLSDSDDEENDFEGFLEKIASRRDGCGA